jgi:Zn-dependent protease with chaperone function
MSEALAAMGQGLPGWAAGMTLASGIVLLVAIVLDRLLASQVSASIRLIPYLAVVIRLALPTHWQGPFALIGPGAGRAVAALPAALVTGVGPAGGARRGLVLALLYLVVTLALLVRWVLARRTVRRSLRGAWPARAAVAALLPSATVLEHPTQGPLVVGVLRPRVVLPLALVESGDEDAMLSVLRHEAAHLARRDPLLMTALQLALVVAWPILPVWLAAARVSALVELACDERVLAGAGLRERRRYGELLLALATGDSFLHRRAAVPAFGWALHARLRALGVRRRWRPPAQIALVTVVAAGALACANGPGPAEADDPVETHGRPAVSRPKDRLDEAAVVRVVKRHTPAIKACYERALKRRDDLKGGRLEVTLELTAMGTVSAAAVQSSAFDDPGLESCVGEAMRDAKFPAAGHPARVEFPVIVQGSL